jgi:polar amino acid transport system substrate-binding protein
MRRLVTTLLLLSVLAAPARAAAEDAGRAMVVGIKPSPPFVVKQADGTWGGLAIDLWKLLAADMGVRVTMRPFEQVPALLDAVERGEVDVAVGALTVTPERERTLDFTMPIYSTGLGIAVRSRGSELRSIARRVLGWQLAAAFGVLIALAAGLYLVARGRAQLRWIAAGVWLAAALAVVSGFASWAASTSAREQIAASIRGPDDLPHVRVTTVPGSTSATYLKSRQVPFLPVATPQDGLRAVAAGKADAIVYDAPILAHLLRGGAIPGAVLLPGVFERQDYAFAVVTDSPLRAELDRHLATRLAGDTWKQLRARALGEP